MHGRLILLSLCLLLSGCSTPISVQMDYLSRRNLASYIVGTPDPHINCPNIGERLIIQWNIPNKYACCEDLHLLLTMRYRNHVEELHSIPIKRKRGTHLFEVINETYFETCGILTYKIELIGNGCVISTWKHQLWAELITFPSLEQTE